MSDTMAFILRLENRKMPDRISSIFNKAENGLAEIKIPAIVFAELGYLSEKGKIEIGLADAREYLDKYKSVSEYPLIFQVVEHAFMIHDIPELHDRLIAAAAKAINIPVLTNDPDIINSSYVQSVWGK